MPRIAIDYTITPVSFYRFICQDGNITSCYVGSTTNFIKRKSYHKSACNSPNAKNHNLKIYQIMRANGGWDNWRMIEITSKICLSKQDAIKQEQIFMEELQADMNARKAFANVAEDRQAYRKLYTTEHADELSEYQKKYYAEHADEIRAKQKKYNAEHADEKKSYDKLYRAEHADKMSEYQKKYYAEHADDKKARDKIYYAEHAEEIRAKKKLSNATRDAEQIAKDKAKKKLYYANRKSKLTDTK